MQISKYRDKLSEHKKFRGAASYGVNFDPVVFVIGTNDLATAELILSNTVRPCLHDNSP